MKLFLQFGFLSLRQNNCFVGVLFIYIVILEVDESCYFPHRTETTFVLNLTVKNNVDITTKHTRFSAEAAKFQMKKNLSFIETSGHNFSDFSTLSYLFLFSFHPSLM